MQGEEAPFTVEMRNRNGDPIPAGGQNLQVKVSGPFGDVPVNQKDNGDGTHSISYKPLDVGAYHIDVKLDNAPVADSPYTVQADAPEGCTLTLTIPIPLPCILNPLFLLLISCLA